MQRNKEDNQCLEEIVFRIDPMTKSSLLFVQWWFPRHVWQEHDDADETEEINNIRGNNECHILERR